MYSPSRQLPTWQHTSLRSSVPMRLLGILLSVLVCTTCTSLYFLTGAHREVSVLRAELEHGASHHTQAQQVAESHLTKLQEQVLSGDTALKAAAQARLQLKSELDKCRAEAKDGAVKLAEFSAEARKMQVAADTQTREATDRLAKCNAELAAVRNGSSASSYPGVPAGVGLANLAAGAAASAADAVREGAAAASDAVQDAKDAGARAAAQAREGAVDAAAGAADRSSEIAAALSQALRGSYPADKSQPGSSSAKGAAGGNATAARNASGKASMETGPGLERAGSQEL